MKETEKKNFGKCHKAKEPKLLNPGEGVWLPEMQTEGIIEKEVSPRSYQVSTPLGVMHRNCQHPRPIPDMPTLVQDSAIHMDNDLVSESAQTQSSNLELTEISNQETSQSSSVNNSSNVYKTRSGRASVRPERYRPT